MSEEEADVSAVLVSWDTGEVHDRAIEAFRGACGDLRAEVVVVDNGSTDGSVERLRADPAVRLFELGVNTGFTHAANVGANAARGRYLLFLNPDAQPSPGSIARLVAVLEQEPNVWGVTPRFLHPDGSPQPFYLRFPGWPSLVLCFTRWGRALDRRLGGRARRRRYYLDRPAPSGIEQVDCVGAACLLVRREEFLTSGGFDERFGNFFQDGDLARRMHRRGRSLLVVGDASVTHEIGVTINRLSEVEREGRYLHDYLQYLRGEPRRRRAIGRAAVAIDVRLRRSDAARLRELVHSGT